MTLKISDATRDEWIASVRAADYGFLRAGSVKIYRSVEGTGIAPGIDAYPHQYLDIGYNPEPAARWLVGARYGAKMAREGWGASIPAGNLKHPGITPLGTSVAVLAREGHDMLSSDCGYCTTNLAACRCGKAGAE